MSKYFKYFFFIVLPLLGSIILIAQYTVPAPEFNTEEELLNFAETKQEKKGACLSYIKLLKFDSTNSKYQYLLAQEWSKIEKKELSFFQFNLKKKGNSPIELYNRLSHNNTQKIRNSGLFGKACLSYFKDKPFIAQKYLDSISNDSHAGLHLLKGLIFETKKNYQKAFQYYLKESKNEKLTIEAKLKIYEYLYSWKKYDKAILLLEIPKFKLKISPTRERYIYYQMNKPFKYLSVLHQHVLKKIDFMGFISAFLIMTLWMLYLLKLSSLSDTKKKTIFIVTLISFFIIYPTLIFYDFMEIKWGFGLTQNVLNDLIYSIFGIGFIEELCKLIPLLILILIRPSFIKSPMDLILIACASALGFSFMENLLYFTSDQLDIISSRAMISVVGHMAGSSIAAFGIVILMFRKTTLKNIVKAISYLLLAVFIHGIFDFWLINDIASNFYYLAYAVLFLEIFIWVKVLNYCLNNSGAYKNKKKIDINRINFILLVLLTSVICIEFLSFVFRHGTTESLPILKDSIIQGLFFIPYLSYRLSRIDISPPSEKKSFKILEKNKAYNLNEILNLKAEITAYKNHGIITKILPSTGVITERIDISGDSNWFEFIPDKEISLNGKVIQALLIKAKKEGAKLNSKNVIIYLRVKFKEENTGEIKNLSFLDWGVLNIRP